MVNDDFVQSLKKEASELEEKLLHVRGLLKLYSSQEEATSGSTHITSYEAYFRRHNGIRESMRKILSSSNGLRPVEVAEKLKATGFEFRRKGKTRFNTVINNELYRMKQAGQLTNEDGRYFLAENDELEGL